MEAGDLTRLAQPTTASVVVAPAFTSGDGPSVPAEVVEAFVLLAEASASASAGGLAGGGDPEVRVAGELRLVVAAERVKAWADLVAVHAVARW